MKKILAAALMVPVLAFAQNAVTVAEVRADRELNTPIAAPGLVLLRHQLGSGTPGYTEFEPATHMGEGIYHAQQYMPQYPTAAVLWPRVIDIECEKPGNTYICEGYNWLPALGRGEYLYVRPHVKAAKIQIVEKIVQVPVYIPGPERLVLKEVPVKKKTQ